MSDEIEGLVGGITDMGTNILGLPDDDELTEALEAQNELQRESAENAKQAKLDAESARKKSMLQQRQEQAKAGVRRRRLRAGNPLLSGASGGFNVAGGNELGGGPAKTGRT